MAILDTSFLVDVLRGRADIDSIVDELDHEDHLLLPTPALMELWVGALNSTLPAKEKTRVQKLIDRMAIADFDQFAAKQSAQIQVQLSRNPIDVQDTMIAGIALSKGETVVTRDAHFARIPGLKVLKC